MNVIPELRQLAVELNTALVNNRKPSINRDHFQLKRSNQDVTFQCKTVCISLMHILIPAFGRWFYSKLFYFGAFSLCILSWTQVLWCYYFNCMCPLAHARLISWFCCQIHTFWALGDLSSRSVGQHKYITKYSRFWEIKGHWKATDWPLTLVSVHWLHSEADSTKCEFKSFF